MKIPVGAIAYVGPPAKPISKEISDAIGAALGKIPEILEAHLPMVYIKGHIDPPAQVLVIVLEENSTSTDAKIVEVLSATLPTNSYLDFTESRPDDPNLAAIRATGTPVESQSQAELGILRAMAMCVNFKYHAAFSPFPVDSTRRLVCRIESPAPALEDVIMIAMGDRRDGWVGLSS